MNIKEGQINEEYNTPDEQGKINFHYHLIELRNRLIFSALFFVICFVISYIYIEDIYEFLLMPLSENFNNPQNRRLIYTSPEEAFMTYLNLSLNSSLLFSLPIFISQFYFFIAPALYKKEKKTILSIIIASCFLLIFAMAIVYFFILPLALDFFLSFENYNTSVSIQMETKVSEYLKLVKNLFFGFIIAFQAPLLIMFLIKINLLSVDILRRNRKYFIVIMVVLAGILTPPDIWSQITLSLIMLVLYELTILASSKFNKKSK